MPTVWEKTLIFFIILLLPSQLAYHFWPSFAYVNSARIDYLSPAVYLTDVLITALLLIASKKRHFKSFPIPGSLAVSILFTLIFLNILFSLIPAISLIRYSYLILYTFLLLYTKTVLPHIKNLILTGLSGALIWSGLIAILQFIQQSSVGGLLWWLGERPLSLSNPMIAKVQIGDYGLFLRSYSTFPHPNSLAVFFALALFIILYFYSRGFRIHKYLILLTILITTIAIILSFSRLVLILFVLSIFYLYFPSFVKSKTIALLLFLGGYVIYNLLPGYSNSPGLRINSYLEILKSLPNNILFGIGLNNSIPYFSNSLSPPTHNIYLLALFEQGIFFLTTLVFLSLNYLRRLKNNNIYFQISLFIILVTGLVENYWLTLHQNLLLLIIFLSIVLLPEREIISADK